MDSSQTSSRKDMTSKFVSQPVCHSCGEPVKVEHSSSGWFSECKKCKSQTAASPFDDHEAEQAWLYKMFGSNFTFGRSSAPVLPKMKKLKVFISGPMSGYPGYNFKKFREIEEKLKLYGAEVVSPERICQKYTQEAVLKNYGLMAQMVAEQQDELLTCNAILLMNGWETSNGSRYELSTALKNKMAIFQEKDMDIIKLLAKNPDAKIGIALTEISDEDWKTQLARKYPNIPAGEMVAIVQEDYMNFYGGPWSRVMWHDNLYYTSSKNIAS